MAVCHTVLLIITIQIGDFWTPFYTRSVGVTSDLVTEWWWTTHMCVNNLPMVSLSDAAAGIPTRDLLFASPTLYSALKLHNRRAPWKNRICSTLRNWENHS